MKKNLFVFFTFIFFCVLIEAASFSVLVFLEKARHIEFMPVPASRISENQKRILRNLLEGREKYLSHSPDLGWVVKANGHTDFYRANSQGIRSDKEYAPVPPENRIRIEAFGDSFTHCDGVKNSDTWEEKLSALHPGLEVLNFGVGGYGLDQAFLRFKKEGPGLHPHIVLIGFWPEDTSRSVNVFRPFYAPATGTPLAKPRFVIKDNALVFLKNPLTELNDYRSLVTDGKETLSRLGAYDYFFNTGYRTGPWDFLASVRLSKIARAQFKERSSSDKIFTDGIYNPDSEAFKVTAGILDAFYAEVLKNNALPVIVFFPHNADFLRLWQKKTKAYQPFLELADRRAYRSIDLVEIFEPFILSQTHPVKLAGHYSPKIHEQVARRISEYLAQNGLTEPASLARATELEKKKHPGN